MTVIITGNNTPTAGGVVYGDGTTYATTTAGTSGRPIVSGGVGAPTFRPYTLPAADGSANQILKTDGAGALSFATPSTGAFTAYFQSADQTITTSGTLTLAHGLGAAPKIVQGFVKNITAQGEYVTGDILSMGLYIDAASERGVTVRIDATNIYIYYGGSATVFVTGGPPSGYAQFLINTRWSFFVRAAA